MLEAVLKSADVQAEAVPDARVPLWVKFIYLAPFASFTGASRLPIGPLRDDDVIRETFIGAVNEVERVARASGVDVPAGIVDQILEVRARHSGHDAVVAADRFVRQGKRIEVESLAGSVVRRGRAVGVPTPMMAALYAVLKPWAEGGRAG